MTSWRDRLGKTTQVLLLLLLGFNLGRYSESFSGRTSAWVALVSCIVGLVLILIILLRDIWRGYRQQEP
jgi:TRAP-type C4-dicarboxylate transport system permease small subunit